MLIERRVLLAMRVEASRELVKRKYSVKLLTSFFAHSFEPIIKKSIER